MINSTKLKKYTLLFGVLFLFPLSLILFFGLGSSHHFNTLPYYGPKQAVNNPETGLRDTLYHRLPDFELTNHEGKIYTLDSLQGKVWVAAFFSTNSPYIQKITKRLLWPNFRYRHESDIVLVCFTQDVSHDTPEVLKAYVDQMTTYHDFPGKWQFLTGNQQDIDSLVQHGFLLNDPQNTSTLMLIDTKGHIRGEYNGNLEEHIKNAIEDIALLKKEIDIQKHEAAKKKTDPNDSGN